MDTKGIIFDIKEFAVFDGPGIRTTVFMKGCPLRCQWCHNPEGMSFERQLMISPKGCVQCGKCKVVCQHQETKCVLCKRCIAVCPLHLRKICGIEITAQELAHKLLRSKAILERNEGGITFSGGEPLAQPTFLKSVLKYMSGVHTVIETSGYCSHAVFKEILQELDLVIMDLKLIDRLQHKYYTGVDNSMILTNLKTLIASKKEFIIRIPLIPGVNDNPTNLKQTAELLEGAQKLIRVELLPYHQTAGAKYKMLGKDYRPSFDVDKLPVIDGQCFEEKGIMYRIL